MLVCSAHRRSYPSGGGRVAIRELCRGDLRYFAKQKVGVNTCLYRTGQRVVSSRAGDVFVNITARIDDYCGTRPPARKQAGSLSNAFVEEAPEHELQS